MDTLVVDPIAELFALGEGKREWVRGSVLEIGPASDVHGAVRGYLDGMMRYYTTENEAGTVKGEQFAERLSEELVRIPDIAFFKKDNLGKIKPTYSEGGADLVIEIVSRSSRGTDRATNTSSTRRRASKSTGSSIRRGGGPSSTGCAKAPTSRPCPTSRGRCARPLS